jgi:hypothetical protein
MSASRRATVYVILLLLTQTAASTQSPTFARSDIATGLTLWQRIVAGDFNQDGAPDLLVVSRPVPGDWGLYLLAGRGDGTFASPVRVATPELPIGLATADVNGDDTLDLLYLGLEGLSVQLGNADGTFGDRILSPPVYSARPPTVADVNDDAKPDVIVATQDGPVSISLGNGDGSFGPPLLLATTDHGRADNVATADLNGDGSVDVLAANIGFPDSFLGSTVEVFLGRGDGTFEPPVGFATGTTPMTILVVDFNEDGRLDLGVRNYQGGSLSVLLGNGDGTFLPKTDYAISRRLDAVSADFNGDGHGDIAVCDPLSILTGLGDGTFANAHDVNDDQPNCAAMVVADFNLDGRPDLALNYAGDSSTVSIYLNTSAPADTLPPSIDLSATPTVLWPADGRTMSVVVSGRVTDTSSGVDPASVRYEVLDEYGTVQPSGAITLDADGQYSAVVPLAAFRRGNDRDGRIYIIVVHATDRAGNSADESATVLVPHDVRAVQR